MKQDDASFSIELIHFPFLWRHLIPKIIFSQAGLCLLKSINNDIYVCYKVIILLWWLSFIHVCCNEYIFVV